MSELTNPAKAHQHVFSRSCAIPIIIVFFACLYVSTTNRSVIISTISSVQSSSDEEIAKLTGNVQRNGFILNSTSTANPSSIVSRDGVYSVGIRNQEETITKSAFCKEPVNRIVYIKTHKTGSTTLVSILERYGYERNLSFAMRKNGHIICDKELFKASMIYRIPFRTRKDFDMLVNHARYNRREMDKVVPNAKYISIIRHPVEQLESVFGYFEIGYHLKITGANPFRTFMSNPLMYYKKKINSWQRIRNGQLFDLGFDHKYDENKAKIQQKIDRLSKEIDFMLINEYFEESLIILRKLFCWEFEDILYLSHGIRSNTHRFEVSEDMAAEILQWNAGDVMLYTHFNQTFWKRVVEYGPDFEKDLKYFRSMEHKAFDKCVDTREKNRKDKRVEKLVLKEDPSILCKNMLYADTVFTGIIRKSMVNRAVLEHDKTRAHTHFGRLPRLE